MTNSKTRQKLEVHQDLPNSTPYLTDYDPSMITTDERHQHLAVGPVVSLQSAMTGRVAISAHIGHEHTADGRWRDIARADAAAP